MYFDIHTHKKFKKGAIYNLDIRKESSYDGAFSVGLHPWWIEGPIDELLKKVEMLAADKYCVIIGESGIDRPWSDKVSLKKQAEIFSWHIRLAQNLNKPLVAHCVKAYSELFSELKNNRFKGSIILHDFNGPEQVIKDFLTLDSYFSYGDKLFLPKSRGLKALKSIPLERLFFESDETEREIFEVYQQAATVLQISITELQFQIKENLKRVLDSQKERISIGGHPLHYLFHH